MRTTRIILPILAICITLFSACKKGEVTGVTLNKTELSLISGTTEQLIATVEPEGAENKEVTWMSANPDIAIVDENGLVTAIKFGWTNIEVITQEGKHTASCSVVVDYKQHVTGVTLNRTELSLAPGDTEQLIATVEPEDADNKEVRWESDNPEVAMVDETGLVTGIKDGRATIRVITQDGNHTAACLITVDYRGKWVGSYDCEEEYSWWIMEGGSGTEQYQTMINITLKGDSTLAFNLERLGRNYDAKADADGHVFKWKVYSSDYGMIGDFMGDSLMLNIGYPGALGYSTSSKFKGKKQNNE